MINTESHSFGNIGVNIFSNENGIIEIEIVDIEKCETLLSIKPNN